MATINVKDAAGDTVAIEKPLAPGRAAAAASRPVALSTEDLAAISQLLTGIVLAAGSALIGKVGIDQTTAGANAVAPAGRQYESFAAGQTDQPIGGTGAAGDDLDGLLIVPASTSPGAVQIKDGGGAAITVFAGGADSLSCLVPFPVPLGMRSAAGAWKVTTGANVSVIAVGKFTA